METFFTWKNFKKGKFYIACTSDVDKDYLFRVCEIQGIIKGYYLSNISFSELNVIAICFSTYRPIHGGTPHLCYTDVEKAICNDIPIISYQAFKNLQKYK